MNKCGVTGEKERTEETNITWPKKQQQKNNPVKIYKMHKYFQ